MTQMTKGGNIPLTAALVRATLFWSGGDGVPAVDGSALLLQDSGKVSSDADFIFYNQPEHVSGMVKLAGTQAGPVSYDVIDVNLAGLPQTVQRIAFAASCDGGTFGQVPGLRLTLSDLSTGAELASFAMTASEETAFVTGELYRRDGAWKFRAVGQGFASGLAGLATEFGIDVGGDGPADPGVDLEDATPDPVPEPPAPTITLPPPSFAAPAPAVPEPTAVIPPVVAPPVVAPPVVAPPVVEAPVIVPPPPTVVAPPAPEPVAAPAGPPASFAVPPPAPTFAAPPVATAPEPWPAAAPETPLPPAAAPPPPEQPPFAPTAPEQFVAPELPPAAPAAPEQQPPPWPAAPTPPPPPPAAPAAPPAEAWSAPAPPPPPMAAAAPAPPAPEVWSAPPAPPPPPPAAVPPPPVPAAPLPPSEQVWNAPTMSDPAPPVTGPPVGPPPVPGAAQTLDNGPIQIARHGRVDLIDHGVPLNRVMMDLSWEPKATRLSVDLDASVIAFDEAGKKLEIVWYQHAKEFDGALQHTGDARGDSNTGSTERILVELSRLPQNVAALVFTVSSFHGHTFTDLTHAMCELLEENGTPIVTYDLTDTQPSTAVLMTILRRTVTGVWQLRAIGEYHDCRTVKKLVDPAARQVGII